MATSIKKQAAKIANTWIKQADEQSKVTVQEKLELRKRLEESNLARESEGKDALSALRRLGGKKLPAGEEIILARRLYAELQVLKRHLKAKGIGIGRFCIDAKIADTEGPSKELHRLTLPPGKDPNDVRLRRGAGKYRLLIEAISKITKESASTLADRVLRGTSLHPAKNVENLSETEMVQTALQSIVDKIDSEFSLFAKYIEVAELKARHIASGSKENWPKWDWFLDPDQDDYEQELAEATNPKYAFWKREIEYEPIDIHVAFEKTLGHSIERTEASSFSSPYQSARCQLP